jgi:hypothetical protein
VRCHPDAALEGDHRIASRRAEDAVDDEPSMALLVELALDDLDCLADAPRLHRHDQLEPGGIADDAVGGQPMRRLEGHHIRLRRHAEDAIDRRRDAMGQEQALDRPDVGAPVPRLWVG